MFRGECSEILGILNSFADTKWGLIGCFYGVPGFRAIKTHTDAAVDHKRLGPGEYGAHYVKITKYCSIELSNSEKI